MRGNKNNRAVCAENGCDLLSRANGRCPHHMDGPRCLKVGCDVVQYSRGLCSIHLQRAWRAGEEPPLAQEAIKQKTTGGGYISIFWEGRNYMEHRLVMECELGRRLQEHETVHHKDGNRKNNDISNLELWSGSHGSGQRVADKRGRLAWL